MQTLEQYLKTIDPHIEMEALPEVAQHELVTFYEFLVFKYQGQPAMPRSEKQRILTEIFQETKGKLPANYTLNREELHER